MDKKQIQFDEQKVQALSSYLHKAIERMKNDEPEQLEKIYKEVSNPMLPTQVKTAWLKAFKLDLLKRKDLQEDFLLIMDAMLTQINWFQENIIEGFHIIKECFTIFAENNNTYLYLIYQTIFEHLTFTDYFKGKEAEKSNTKTFCVQICGQKFYKKLQLLKYVHVILARQEYISESITGLKELNAEDKEFMLEFFKNHPQAEEKFTNMETIMVGYFAGKHQTTNCFFIKKKCGNCDSTSYVKTVNRFFDVQMQEERGQLKLGEKEFQLMELTLGMVKELLVKFGPSRKKLVKIIRVNYPHRAQDLLSQKSYLLSILSFANVIIKTHIYQLTKMCPGLHRQIISICIEKILLLDLEVTNFRKQSTNKLTIKQRRIHDKLSQTMMILYKYIDSMFTENSDQPDELSPIYKEVYQKTVDEKQSMIEDIMSVFREKILKVKKPGSIQFLIVFLCSKSLKEDQSLSKIFLKSLLKIILSPEKNTFLRKNACQFIGSFICMASYLDDRVCMRVLKILLKFQKEYLKDFLINRKKSLEQAIVTRKFIDKMYVKHKIFNYAFLTSIQILTSRTFSKDISRHWKYLYQILKISAKRLNTFNFLPYNYITLLSGNTPKIDCLIENLHLPLKIFTPFRKTFLIRSQPTYKYYLKNLLKKTEKILMSLFSTPKIDKADQENMGIIQQETSQEHVISTDEDSVNDGMVLRKRKQRKRYDRSDYSCKKLERIFGKSTKKKGRFKVRKFPRMKQQKKQKKLRTH